MPSQIFGHKTTPFKRTLIAAGVAAALGTSGAQFAISAELEEIVVTARQRSESSQDVPMMIQSISGEDMEKQGITTLEDFSTFVAGLNVIATTPGQNTIVFRGVSDGGGFLVDPTAAIYLDEQPMSQTSWAPDVYPVDIARIEALAGPQSTLFGASSQSGAIRVITNKPDTEAFSANIGLGMSQMESGGMSHDIDATVNVPLSDNVAIRLAGFNSEDAGFIDNVLGTTVVDTVFGSGLGGLKNNSALVEDDINTVEWQGVRASVRWLVDDNWTVTATTNYQDLKADGFSDYDRTTGDLQTVKFADEFRTDEWTQTSVVIEGDLGFAQLVSATSYYDRDFLYQHDTQSYAAYFHYSLGIYYGYATYDFGTDPVGALWNDQNHQSFTQELRLVGSTNRSNWTVGAFYQNSEEFWDFVTYVDGYRDSPAFATWSYYYPGIAPTDTWWNSFQSTDRTDKAVFGELELDVIEDKLTVLLGGRWYEVERELSYTVERPDARVDQQLPNRTAKDEGFIPKVGLEWSLTNDVMAYGIYSEGYRVGGTNRGRGMDQGGPTLPVIYDSDTLKNVELGVKSQFMDGRLQVNAVYYSMNWENMQLEVVDPSTTLGIPWQMVVANVGDAEVTGYDIDMKAVIGNNIEVGYNRTVINDASVTAPAFFEESRVPGGQIASGLDPSQALPMFADVSYSLYVQIAGIKLFGGESSLRFQHSYVGTSLNQLTDGFTSPRMSQGDYAISDAIFSVDMDGWRAQLYVKNIGDERGISYEDTQDFDQLWGNASSNVIRPRSFGISFRKYF
ncbi:MAG: TonB-dependent receptor [Pseudomonadales bacterium]|nr:TonB-dependent receptor [Pseudomonadales bacterium]